VPPLLFLSIRRIRAEARPIRLRRGLCVSQRQLCTTLVLVERHQSVNGCNSDNPLIPRYLHWEPDTTLRGGRRKPTRGSTIHISLDSAVKLASRAKPKCRAKTVRAKQLPKYPGHQSNGIPVFLEMPRSCLTTGKIRGTPFSRRIRSASRSGSPGIRGPLVPGAGFVARKTRM
jgi:hypothetical protein